MSQEIEAGGEAAFPGLEKWERERDAFRRLLPGLLSTHRGQYVAIHDGRVVDEGPDPVELTMRVLRRIGYMAIHVDLVTDEPRRPLRIPSPWLAGPRLT